MLMFVLYSVYAGMIKLEEVHNENEEVSLKLVDLTCISQAQVCDDEKKWRARKRQCAVIVV